MIQDTSLEAYNIIRPKLGNRQKLIFDIIERFRGMSNLDISRYLSLPINSVTPRVKELRDKGLVVLCGEKVDRVTGRRVKTWMVNNNI